MSGTKHWVFQRRWQLPLLYNHLSGPKYTGAVTFDDVDGKTRVTMYWTFETEEIYTQFEEAVAAGNEGNFDRMSEVAAGRR